MQSFQFCAASAFLAKPVGSYSYYREAYNNPEVLTLAQKVKPLVKRTDREREITVTLHSGETYRVEEKRKGKADTFRQENQYQVPPPDIGLLRGKEGKGIY